MTILNNENKTVPIERNEQQKLSFSDVVPKVNAERRISDPIMGKSYYHPCDYFLESGEMVSNQRNHLMCLYSDGRKAGMKEPYCGGLYRYWKELVGDLNKFPISYVQIPLYYLRIPNVKDREPNIKEMMNYSFSEKSNYTDDIKLVSAGQTSTVMFKSNGYPSGVVLIGDKIHLVSTPLTGINQLGELMFLKIANKSNKKVIIDPSSIGIIGEELKFSPSLYNSLIKLFEQAPKN